MKSNKKRLLSISILAFCLLSVYSFSGCSLYRKVKELSSSSSTSATETPTVTTPQITYEIFEYDTYTVTVPRKVVCHVGDTFELEVTSTYSDDITCTLEPILGCYDYFTIDNTTITAIAVGKCDVLIDTEPLGIPYITEIEVIA